MRKQAESKKTRGRQQKHVRSLRRITAEWKVTMEASAVTKQSDVTCK